MLQNLLSAAVVNGALRVKNYAYNLASILYCVNKMNEKINNSSCTN